MKFRVTGGEDGTLGIDVGNRRYEAGDMVEMTASDADWLVECGALVKDSEWTPGGTKSEPEPEAELEEDDLDDEPADLEDEEGDDL